jgi:hypothetical protein
MTRRPAPLAVACLAIATLALFACRSSSSGDKTATPSVAGGSATPGGSPVPSSTPDERIRDVDLANVADVKQALSDANSQFEPARVIYADLTGTGQTDAVVPIASGGTLGDVEFLVLAPDDTGGATTLLDGKPTGQDGLAVAVVGGKLVMTEPVPGPDDPECCPSQLKKTTYAWDGAAFVVESTTTETNPAGGAKGTPSLPSPSR